MKKEIVFSSAFIAAGISFLMATQIKAEEAEPDITILPETESLDQQLNDGAEANIDENIETDIQDNEISRPELPADNGNNIFESSEQEDTLQQDQTALVQPTQSSVTGESEQTVVLEQPAQTMAYAAAKQNQQTLNGIDISCWNPTVDPAKVEGDFIIIKATGGNSYVNPYFEKHAQETLAAGKLLGFYHFAQDWNCGGTVQEEATHFYQNVKGYLGKGIAILDWEADALRLGPKWAQEFLDTFYSISGVRCLIYMSVAPARNYDWTSVANSGYKLWVAQYASNDRQNGYDIDPWYDSYGVGAFKEPVMRQYTSNGYIKGYDKNLDLNLFYGTKQTWMQLAEVQSLSSAYNEMYRMYNPNTSEHFFTKESGERDFLIRAGWTYEGVAWKAPKTGNPVYRLYNPNVGDHHYTLSAYERDYLVSVGWNYENIGWYSDLNQEIPLYRSYNPNAVVGMHHYTASKTEHLYLISLGWRDEGIAWFGVSESTASKIVQPKLTVSAVMPMVADESQTSSVRLSRKLKHSTENLSDNELLLPNTAVTSAAADDSQTGVLHLSRKLKHPTEDLSFNDLPLPEFLYTKKEEFL